MKYVYSFKEGNKNMRNLLGGKGANLAEMINLGLPIPNGFTVSTDACHEYYNTGKGISGDMEFQILSGIKNLETDTGKVFGDPKNPLLVSVRSGAPVSMPGMMDTILNLGMNDEIAEEMAKSNPRMAYDAYRRFISMYATVAKGYPDELFNGYLDTYKKAKGYESDLELTADDFKAIVTKYKDNYLEVGGEHFPDDPKVQLLGAIEAVFASWNNDRAITYRRVEGISDDLGTAVNVQEMVYGNWNNMSGSGVLFSRNPIDGHDELTGEYLLNAQGEDVVAGIRTAPPISALQKDMPEVYNELYTIAKKMEEHYTDMQDMEFTIENGRLFILQTRNGKRTPGANVRIALDLLKEGKIDEKECLRRIKPQDLEVLMKPAFDADALKKAVVLTKGLAASPGAAYGHVIFKSEDAKARKKEDTILVRNETSPEDIDGMIYSNGILTKNGGLTSHAAVVARGFGECAVVGAGELEIDEVNEVLKVNGYTIKKDDYISIDGTSGVVYLDKLPLSESGAGKEMLDEVLKIVSKYEKMDVRANADTPEAAKQAREFGAKGIGLVRTEHMFFSPKRIHDMRKMILSTNVKERRSALSALEAYQMQDFYGILKEMNPYPVIVRYLDPPLHEFLPKEAEEKQKLAESLGIELAEVEARIKELEEVNPMMGFRGCRLGVKYPEISIMQTKALIKAAIKCREEGLNPNLEMMVPLVDEVEEFKYIKDLIDTAAKETMEAAGIDVDYKVGTMIETPRGALMSEELSEVADFYSFGTNDLTQLTFGLSRDDAGKFLDSYYDKKIYALDPFKTIDTQGVGKLMAFAKAKAKRDIEMGICGEHGGEEASIAFCNRLGLNYVSCSPFRVPSARLVSAKCAIGK